jgi:hypothetical protein
VGILLQVILSLHVCHVQMDGIREESSELGAADVAFHPGSGCTVTAGSALELVAASWQQKICWCCEFVTMRSPTAKHV